MSKNNLVWFEQYKELKQKILKKNKQIEELDGKIEHLKREIVLEQLNKNRMF